MQAIDVELDGVSIDASKLDPVAQTVTTQKLVVSDGTLRLLPTKLRFAWPSELDLMAQLAGPAAARALRELRAPAVHGREPEPRVGVRTLDTGRLKIARRSTICTSW